MSGIFSNVFDIFHCMCTLMYTHAFSQGKEAGRGDRKKILLTKNLPTSSQTCHRLMRLRATALSHPKVRIAKRVTSSHL